jgi:integrase
MPRKPFDPDDLGTIHRREHGRPGWRIALGRWGFVYTRAGEPITTKADAVALLKLIRAEIRVALRERRTVEDGLRRFLASDSKTRSVEARYEAFIASKQAEVDGGKLSPRTVQEYRRYARPGGEVSFWRRKAVGDVTSAALEDWNIWLSKRKLSDKTCKNILGAFSSFLHWLKRRGELSSMPEMPKIEPDEYIPRILTLDQQRDVLARIPENERGIFYALAIGLRPGEARALNHAHLEHDGERFYLLVETAVKGGSARSDIRGTKSGKARRLPASAELEEWLTKHRDPKAFGATPLFKNPRTRDRWSHWALWSRWKVAAEAAGVVAGLYTGTRHTFATAALEAGVGDRALQAFLGHSDPRMTEKYAKLQPNALVRVVDLLKKK